MNHPDEHFSNLHGQPPGYDDAFKEVVPAPYPIRTTVGSALWHILEIDVVARLRD